MTGEELEDVLGLDPRRQRYSDGVMFTELSLMEANVDLLRELFAAKRREFEELRVEKGWPRYAAPVWELRWHYTDLEAK